MKRYAFVKVHGIAAPKSAGDVVLETTVVQIGGRPVEHFVLEKVTDQLCVCHPGTTLAPSGLRVAELKNKEPCAKRQKLATNKVSLPVLNPGPGLSALMAQATLRAEMERAVLEQTQPDRVHQKHSKHCCVRGPPGEAVNSCEFMLIYVKSC